MSETKQTRRDLRKSESAFWWQKVIGKIGVTYLIFQVLISGIILGMSFVGLKTMNVVSESMVPVYNVGDLLIVTERYNAIAPGDIVIFQPDWFKKGKVVHRVESIQDEVLITKGDNNPGIDPPSNISDIQAEVVTSIPYIGAVMTKPVILTSTLIALILFGISSLILRKEYWTKK